MRVEVTSQKVKVVLSKRNLLALLEKVKGFPAGGYMTIVKPDPTTGILIVATGEPDELHYSEDRGPAGVMHLSTEVAMREYWERELLITEAENMLVSNLQPVEEVYKLIRRLISSLEKAQQ